jgi:hypothetical protein
MNDTENQPLRRVTLTFMPHGGFPQDRHFDHITPADLAFVLGALHGRKRRSLSGRAEVVAALDEARKNELEWYADQARLSVARGLGWWHRLLPTRVVERIVEGLLDQYYDTTAQWMAQLADLHAQVEGLTSRVAVAATARPKPSGPQLLCGHKGCTRGVPLAQKMLLPAGWSWGEDDGHALPSPYCPEHPAETAIDLKVAS